MSYYVRVFSQSDDQVSLGALCDVLREEGYAFATSPGKGESDFSNPDWDFIALQYDESKECIELERNLKSNDDEVFTIEQGEFLQVIKEAPYSKNTKKVKAIVENAVQIFAFDCDDDLDDDGWKFLECMLDFLCDATDGYVQVDEEGIYDQKGDLLLAIE